MIQVIALIDLQGGGGKHLARTVGRADLLAPEAHDAGISVRDLFPTQVFHRRRAELFNGLVIEINKIQFTNGSAFGLQREVNGSKKDMNVLGIREIGQERDYRANRQPE